MVGLPKHPSSLPEVLDRGAIYLGDIYGVCCEVFTMDLNRVFFFGEQLICCDKVDSMSPGTRKKTSSQRELQNTTGFQFAV